MSVTIKEIFTKRDKVKFFKFYHQLYKDNQYCAPNFIAAELDEFDPKKNDAFRFIECRMFLAYRGKKIVGRIAGILHHGVNQKNNVKQLRFTRFDFIDDNEVVDALIGTLMRWAKQEELTELIGPMSCDDLHEEGMLIEGFDQPTAYIEIYNHAYYAEHMKRLNAHKVVDWVGYRVEVPEKMDERLEKLSLLLMEKHGYEILDIEHTPTKQNDKYFLQAMEVCEVAFRNLYGVSPLSEKQMKANVKDLKTIMIPEFLTLVTQLDNETQEKRVIAYGFIIPSISKAMRKGKGSMLRAIPQLIKDMKHPEVAEMMSIGVLDEHLKKGVPAIILYNTLKGLLKNKTRWLDTGPELEDNHDVQNLWKNYNRIKNKKRRCWGLYVDEGKNVPLVEPAATETATQPTETSTETIAQPTAE